MAHAVDLLVHRRILLDIGVGARDIGLGLVVVVIGDEILDRVVREEALELAIELGGQRLVGREHERRALRRLDHLGHGEGLARAGDAEQHLVALMRVHLRHQLGDGLRLVAFGLELGLEAQGGMPPSLLSGRGGRCGTNSGPPVPVTSGWSCISGCGASPKPGGRRSAPSGKPLGGKPAFARDGARLGARAEGPGNTMGHGRNMAAACGSWKPLQAAPIRRTDNASGLIFYRLCIRLARNRV